jgi:hypothetical protein
VFAFKAISLFFSLLRPRSGRFWTIKFANQSKENLYKLRLFVKFPYNCVLNAKVLYCSPLPLALFSIFALCLAFLLFINEINQMFLSLFVSPGWWVSFTILN